MKKILSYPLTIIFYLLFGLTLLIMHPVQWLCYNLGGYNAHHFAVKMMNLMLVYSIKVLGTTHAYYGKEKLPKNVPLILVSNHQSMHEVSPVESYLAEFHPKFIAKIELGKGLPSISYNLKKGGSVLIDRKDSKQALTEIKKLALSIEKNKYSALIFPEGTRGRDGVMKPFKDNGLKILTKYAPNALIVPISVNNFWKLEKDGAFPLNLGIKTSVYVHEPIDPKSMDFDQMMIEIQDIIKSKLDQ